VNLEIAPIFEKQAYKIKSKPLLKKISHVINNVQLAKKPEDISNLTPTPASL